MTNKEEPVVDASGKPEAPAKLEPRLIAEVANAVELDEVRLDALSARMPNGSSAKATELGLDFSFQTAWARVDSLPGFWVRFSFESTAVETGGELTEPNKIFEFQATYVLEYRLKNVLSQEWEPRIGAFSQVNGVINAWPYVRADFQSTIVRFGLPAVILPVFRPGKPSKGSMRFPIAPATE